MHSHERLLVIVVFVAVVVFNQNSTNRTGWLLVLIVDTDQRNCAKVELNLSIVTDSLD